MTELRIAHMYPQEMNIYGDTGNVLVLRRRLQWRELAVSVVPVGLGDELPNDIDIVLGGGGQDATQGDIGRDFVRRAPQLRSMADDGVVMLAICGAYQLLGREFRTQTGRVIQGAGVLDVETVGSSTRLIGNHSVETKWGRLVGYENHSGLTRLLDDAEPLARTVSGCGNNGEDSTEGVVRDNVFGTYLHGPVLAKSPAFADELLRRAFERRGITEPLAPLGDELESRAATVAAGRPR
ncbi:glutamine amidotransferase [uncultured Agrococcus sp.]|uniref:type 1 glutamine amidotransferase n=1 Tax=uncultured Agrococcus sp. TaxID=382258 RepID=UPI0025F0F1B2|nr:glutamine amidotransferase [uncultured Agrococcus sp.]